MVHLCRCTMSEGWAEKENEILKKSNLIDAQLGGKFKPWIISGVNNVYKILGTFCPPVTVTITQPRFTSSTFGVPPSSAPIQL